MSTLTFDPHHHPSGPTPMGLDTMAIAGLVLAFLFWPLGLVCSVLGVMRTGPGKRSGRVLAVIGLVVSTLCALSFFLVFLPAMTSEEVPETSGVSLAEAGVSGPAAGSVPPGTPSQQSAFQAAQVQLMEAAQGPAMLVRLLDMEGHSVEDATWAVERLPVDWNQQAVLLAQAHLAETPLSRPDIPVHLEMEGFTPEQVAYAVAQTTP